MRNYFRREILILGAILLFALGLRLWNLAGPDMATDDALYSFRALGWFDYVASENYQSTPVTWFERPQWWQGLSFHDAPPLVFSVQWFFFTVFGPSLWAARLPFVLAGVASVFSLFLLARLVGGVKAGLWAAAFLSVMNYHLWVSRIGFLESFVILWGILALYFFIKARERPRSYAWWGIAVALGVLTKYTFFFLAPVFAIALLFWQRSAFEKKQFYIGILLFFLLISPLVAYNFMMWSTRGHFDAALSSMVGETPEDFKGFSREIGGGFDILKVIRTFAGNMSFPFAILVLLGSAFLVWLLFSSEEYEARKNYALLGLAFSSGLVVLALVGGSDRFVVILAPFAALFAGLGAVFLLDKIKGSSRIAFYVLGLAVLGSELLFAVQNQLLPEPIVDSRFSRGGVKPVWAGYRQLESFVGDFYREFPHPSYVIFSRTPQIIEYQKRRVESFLEEGGPQQEHLLVYDDRMSWFAAVWIFERRRLYDVATIPSLTQFLYALSQNGARHFTRYGFKDVTLILTTNKLQYESESESATLEKFSRALASRHQPIQELHNQKGESVFKVFRLPLDDAILASFLGGN